MVEHHRRLVPYAGDHLVEHIKALVPVFDDGILRAHRPQTDALTELIHRVDVIHPMLVDGAEQIYPFDLAHIDAVLLEVSFLRGIGFSRRLVDRLLERGGVLRFEGGRGYVYRKELPDGVDKSAEIPGIGLDVGGAVEIHAGIDRLGYHVLNGFLHVLAHEHLAALTVDDLTHAVHNVVVLEDVFADIEVVRFDALLRVLDILGEELEVEVDILSAGELIHEPVHPVRAEALHQVVLHGYVEAGLAGVALTTGAAAQLVVDTPGFVALRADYVQTARLDDLLMLLIGADLEARVELLVLLPRGKYLLIVGLRVARGVLDHLGLVAVVSHRPPRKEIGVAAEQYIRSASRHVGGDRNTAEFARLGDYLRLARVLLGVQNLVLYAAFFQHIGEHFALFNRDRTDQQRLTGPVDLDYLFYDGAEFGVLVNEYLVVQVDPLKGLVRGYLHDVQPVYALELVLLGLRGTGHAGELREHTEVVLIGDGRNGAVLVLHLHAFLGFERLMQTVRIPAAEHYTAGEFVDDQHLAVLHDVILVDGEQRVRLQCLDYVMVELRILGRGDILYIEILLRFPHAAIGKGDGARLYVAHIVAALLLFLAAKELRLGLLLNVGAALQPADEPVRADVHIGRFVAASGDYERRPRLVDEDRVDLVHDGVIQLPLHHRLLVDRHIVPQVIEAELGIRAVGYVAVIRRAALLGIELMHNAADGQPEEGVDLAHPARVAGGKVVVHGDDVHAVAGQGVKVRGQSGDERLSFAGLHLGYAPLMQHYAADELNVEMPHADGPNGGLAHGGERLGEDIVKGLAVLQSLAELGGLCTQLLIGELLHIGLKRVYLLYNG